MENDLKKSSLVEEAYETIRNKILDFELYPGQDISDFKLHKELGMSRTPIRQALQQLKSDGLIRDDIPGKAYIVCEITDDEIIELFDAREGIELTALRLFMENGVQPSDLEMLSNINDFMDKCNQEEKLKLQFIYDQKFHDFLVNLSGNKKLTKFHESLLSQLMRLRVLSYLERSYQKKAFDDRQLIIKYIMENNVEKALETLSIHLRTSKRDYRDLINKRVSLDSFGMLRFLMQTLE